MDDNTRIQQLNDFCEELAAFLASREKRFSVEVRDSVVWSRRYIGASKESTDEHYMIQVDYN